MGASFRPVAARDPFHFGLGMQFVPQHSRSRQVHNQVRVTASAGARSGSSCRISHLNRLPGQSNEPGIARTVRCAIASSCAARQHTDARTFEVARLFLIIMDQVWHTFGQLSANEGESLGAISTTTPTG